MITAVATAFNNGCNALTSIAAEIKRSNDNQWGAAKDNALKPLENNTATTDGDKDAAAKNIADVIHGI
jgi:cytochrome c551/c552